MPPITATVDVYKNLEGRALQDGEFDFILKDQQGQIIERVSNLANEVVPFSDLVFDKPGRYIYTVEEVDNQLPGVIYDTTPRTLYFNIEQDPVTGSLYIAHYSPEMIFFQNTFTYCIFLPRFPQRAAAKKAEKASFQNLEAFPLCGLP